MKNQRNRDTYLIYVLAAVFCMFSISLNTTALKAQSLEKAALCADSVSSPKTGMLSKIGQQLTSIYCADGKSIDFVAAHPQAVSDGKFLLTAVAENGQTNALESEVRDLGGETVASYKKVVSAWLPIESLGALSQSKTLNFARLAVASSGSRRSEEVFSPVINKPRVGAVTGQHVKALGLDPADLDLFTNGINGSGVEIGSFSISFDCLGTAAAGAASGDIPALGSITVTESTNCGAYGSDEIRALIEVEYDIAPGTTHRAHAAFNGVAAHASGIANMASNGVSVMADDAFWYSTPWFQPGVISQAINEAYTNNDVAFFSHAGNFYDNSYESDFVDSGVNGPTCGGPLHDFNPGGGVDTILNIDIGSAGNHNIGLQWNQPYASAGSSGSASDFALNYHRSNGSLWFFSDNNNIGADPSEHVFRGATGATTGEGISIEYCQAGAVPSTHMKVMFWTNGWTPLTVTQYMTPGTSTIRGHSNAEHALTVGGVNYYQTPAYGQPIGKYAFSSFGGIALYFDENGVPLFQQQAPTVFNKPEVLAPTGQNTTFFGCCEDTIPEDPDTDPNFYGTSASAPAAAGLAALMRQLDPTMTAQDVYDCITNTALDIGAGGFDFETGNGFIDGPAALGCANGDWSELANHTPAFHIQGPSCSGAILGATISTETGVDPNVSDSDGVTFLTSWTEGQAAQMQLSATSGTGTGRVSCWVDWNADNDFGDTGEQICNQTIALAGNTTCNFTVDPNDVSYSTGDHASVRCRLYEDSAETPDPAGAAICAEVEDHAAVIGADWADAPDSHGTDSTDGGEGVGPSHLIVPTLYLGQCVDAETDGQADPSADGDDNAVSATTDGTCVAGEDEDGLDDESQLDGMVPGVQRCLDITSSGAGLLDAWIDFNANGVFDHPAEQIFASQSLSSGSQNLCFTPPSTMPPAVRFARFRLSSAGALLPTGPALDGEVEDYFASQSLPVELTYFNADLDGRSVELSWETKSENSNAGFEVQHAWGQLGFETMTFIEGRGSSLEATQYQSRMDDLSPGIHNFRLKQIDLDGSFNYSSVVEVDVDFPGEFLLEAAYPNPFNPSTTIRFTSKDTESVSLELYDLTGKLVKVLFDGEVTAGETQSIRIDGSALNSGSYLVRLIGPSFQGTEQIILIK